MDITNYVSGITANITNEIIPKSIPATTVGNGFVDLATLTKTNVELLQSTVTGNTTDITALKANQTIVGIVQGKNLFNKDVPAANIGRIISSVGGNTASGATYETSDYIDVSAYPSGQTFAGKSLALVGVLEGELFILIKQKLLILQAQPMKLKVLPKLNPQAQSI